MIPYYKAIQQARRGQIGRCCLLTGDSLLIKELTAAVSGGMPADKLPGQLSLSDALDMSLQPSLLAPHRVLFADNVQFFSSKNKCSRVEEEKLEKFLSNNNEPGATIIFSASSVDKRLKAVKIIDKHGWFIDCRPLKGSALQKWIHSRLQQLGVKAESDAVQALSFRCGNDMQLIDRECKKLAVYLNPGETLTQSIVSLLITVSGEADIFALTDALGEKKLKKAQKEYKRLIIQGQAPVYILHMAARHFRLLYHYALASRDGMGESAVASLLGVHPFVAKKLNQQHKQVSLDQLELQLLNLAQLDERIKTGKIDPLLGLGLFISGIGR